MNILKLYDDYLTNNLNEINEIMVNDKPIYMDIDCDYSNYLDDLYKYSIVLFGDFQQICYPIIEQCSDGLKRTFHSNTNVINVYNSVKQLIIEHKLREINSDFQ